MCRTSVPPSSPARLIASTGATPQRSFWSIGAPIAISRSIARGVRAKARIEPPLGASGGRPCREQRIDGHVVLHQQRLDQPDPRAAADQRVLHVRRVAMDREHQRRPEIIFAVAAVRIGARVEQQSDHVPALRLDRDVERLRPSAPIGMRADSICQPRIGGEQVTHQMSVAVADGAEEGSGLRLAHAALMIWADIGMSLPSTDARASAACLAIAAGAAPRASISSPMGEP